MKKLLRKLLVGSFLSLLTLPAVAAPGQIYVRGLNSDWNGYTNMLKPSSTDADLYEGTFNNLPALEFKLTENQNWDNSTTWGLPNNASFNLFSDKNYSATLTNNNGGNNIKCGNWVAGGTVTIQFKYSTKQLTLISTTQPAESGYVYTPPSKVYIKGDINSWNGNENSALTLQNTTANAQGQYIYQGTIASLSGSFKIGETLGASTWNGINMGCSDSNQTITIGKQVACSDNGSDFKLSSTYSDVTVTFTYNPNGASYLLLSSESGPSYPQTLYVIGNVLNQSWSPSKGVALTTTDGGQTFSGEVDLTSSPSYFSFAEKLSPASDPSNWDAGPNTGVRYAPSEDTAATADGKSMVLPTGNASSASWSIAGGTYNINVNIKDGTFSMTPVVKTVTALSLLGQFNDNGSVSEDWNAGKTMTAGADNKTFTISDVKMMGKDGATDAYFRFKTGDGLQYGPETEGEASLTAANPLVQTSDKAYYLKNGTYSFTVNVEDWTFTVTGIPDVTTPTNPDVYIAGSFNGWGDAIGNEEYKFVDEGDQIYTGSFNVPKGSSFQIVVGSTWYGSKEGEGNVTLDASQSEVELDLATGYENNFVLTNWPGGNIDFTVTLEDMLVVLEYEFPEVEEKPTLYVVGDDINGSELWAVGTDNVMTYNEADGTYTWSGTKLGGKFKIFDGDWNGDYNIGAPANAEAIELGTPFTVQKGNYPENIFLAENTYIENPEIVLDLEKLTITLTGTVVSTAPYVPDYITLKGSFDEWGDGVKLEKTEDGTYVGIGVIPASTNQYKYVELKLDAGNNQWYGPADNQYDITLTSDEPTTVDMNVKAEGNWYLQNWDEEGEITFTVDWDAKTLTLLYEAKVADVWYIRGKFNDYNPADNSEWALNPVEDENGVYSGTFTVESGEFSFNFLSPYGTVFIPDSGETEEITFTDGVYNGKMDMAYEESEEAYYWEFPNWTGGEFTVTINLDENSITIETDAEHDTDAVNALYRFTEDDAIYNLQGVKVSNPAKGQIYIINGKKAVLR